MNRLNNLQLVKTVGGRRIRIFSRSSRIVYLGDVFGHKIVDLKSWVQLWFA